MRRRSVSYLSGTLCSRATKSAAFIVDANVPGIDADELCAMLRNVCWFMVVPIILLCPPGQPHPVLRQDPFGPEVIVATPGETGELSATVSRLLG